MPPQGFMAPPGVTQAQYGGGKSVGRDY
jgi:hypothetical protein